jgi:integrase
MQISKAKSKEREYKLTDGYGLFLLVTPSGGKLWRLDYRFEGKRKTLTFGSYPVLSLADARQRREDARKLLNNGQDPGAIKKMQKVAAEEQAAIAATTFERVAREWHEHKRPEWSENHAGRLLKRLEQDVFPFIGEKPISEIRTPELVGLLQRIATRTLETAQRLKIAVGMVFQYAVLKGLIDSNPAASLRGVLPTVKHKHMAAPTEPKAVAELLRAIDGFSGSFVVKCALQLAPLLFVRPGELRAMEWEELDLDGKQWSIPGHKMKMKLPHLVPLSKQTLDILKQLHPLTGSGRYAFPCLRSPLKCMSENTINASLRRMGFGKDEITGHGFRAMARTMLHEILGFTPDAIEAQLAHVVPDRLGRAYNRTQFLDERRRMMQQWADYLDGLKVGAKVIPLKRTA